MNCSEAPDEPTTSSTEPFLQLSCFISTEVKYMHSGLKSVGLHTHLKIPSPELIIAKNFAENEGAAGEEIRKSGSRCHLYSFGNIFTCFSYTHWLALFLFFAYI